MKALVFILGFLFPVSLIYCQDINKTSTDYLEFANYLIDHEYYSDAELFIENLHSKNFDKEISSEIYYLEGWNYYLQKKLELSIKAFKEVDTSSNYFVKTLFFKSYNQIFLKQYINASKNLINYSFKNTDYKKLANFELAGIALLNRDSLNFNKYSNEFEYDFYPIVKQETNFTDYAKMIGSYKQKSYVVAGVLSSIVPGLGKVYAGRLGDGVSAFLLVSTFGAVTLENVFKLGIKNPKTLLFGSIFSIFYLGNIWGSVISIKMQRDEFNNEINNKILFDLHIPLRTVFN